MKANVASVFRTLVFLLLSIVLHVQASGRSMSLAKARGYFCRKSGFLRAPAVPSDVTWDQSTPQEGKKFNGPYNTFAGVLPDNSNETAEPTSPQPQVDMSKPEKLSKCDFMCQSMFPPMSPIGTNTLTRGPARYTLM
ncbi:hypothetical protein, conserved [Babesia ovata]|uniref:Uncharacterized protein n=1 Tax=Babesia ovata TaxID=189622 RepID=A0A2H6KBG1_9APIC|nr:uncharacterized protein BOVATA_018240 [Babesia ovata]GBE60331.1 hypothetical protein, conserved [Babesia ovata]